MSINEFVEMTIFLCLICLSIYDKMQGFIYESGLFIFFINLLIFLKFFLRFMQKFKMRENDFCEVTSRHCRYPAGQKFRISRSVSEINAVLCLTQKFKMAVKSGGKTFFAK